MDRYDQISQGFNYSDNFSQILNGQVANMVNGGSGGTELNLQNTAAAWLALQQTANLLATMSPYAKTIAATIGTDLGVYADNCNLTLNYNGNFYHIQSWSGSPTLSYYLTTDNATPGTMINDSNLYVNIFLMNLPLNAVDQNPNDYYSNMNATAENAFNNLPM